MFFVARRSFFFHISTCRGLFFLTIVRWRESTEEEKSTAEQVKYSDLSILEVARTCGSVTDWEHKFYSDIHGKETLSQKQHAIKDKIDYKLDLSSAKGKNAISDFEYKFLVDNYGKESLSEKQLAIKKKIDPKLSVWKAFKAKVLNDFELGFMVSIAEKKAESLSAKQKPIFERIESQMARAAPAVACFEDDVITEWEKEFFISNVGKDKAALSENQSPIMDRLEKKILAHRAFKSNAINRWQLDFYKDVVSKTDLSEKQLKKKEEVEEAFASVEL